MEGYNRFMMVRFFSILTISSCPDIAIHHELWEFFVDINHHPLLEIKKGNKYPYLVATLVVQQLYADTKRCSPFISF